MNTSYASFDTPNAVSPLNSPEQLEFEAQCEWAGYHYAKAGNEKLPAMITVGERRFPVVRSRLLEARAFSKGWRRYWTETLGCTPAEYRKRQRAAKAKAKTKAA